MRVQEPDDYEFLGFERSHLPSRKYNAILINRHTARLLRVPFGDVGYQHYRDRTGLRLWSHMDHADKKRRQLFLARHGENATHKFSSAYFAVKYLW